ncbi:MULTISPECIES: response regulator transcription factor [Listeria]|uniref:response regulator transcription factor n=1 Tax=Listeria TaxID=1637 RepID=UPI000B594F86|nr:MULTISPECIES: response regulator transcription factor [Listeria]
MKILIVDDEPKILDVVEAYLVAKDYLVFRANSGETAFKKYTLSSPDLIILDLMLPDKSGLEICKEIRASGDDTPIIMLTAKSKEQDILTGLQLGADDYIVKPFSPKELVMRVETVLRRSGSLMSKKNNKLAFDQGTLIIYPGSRQVFLHEEEIFLTKKEFDLLVTLAMNPTQYFPREALVEALYGCDSINSDRAIDSHIKNLRQKIEVDSKKPRFILTIHGKGYRFGCAE